MVRTIPKNQGGVAAGHKDTVNAAVQILEVGGNAWDAALAAMAAACVAEPVLASLGGGGFMLLYGRDATDGPALYDFFAQTPRIKKQSDTTEFYPVTADFGTQQQEFHVGAGSVATPGMIKGMKAIHDDHCILPIDVILQPAIALAKNGVKINDFQSYLFSVVAPIYDKCEESLVCYGSKDGGLVKAGDWVVNSGLGQVFNDLSIDGLDGDYVQSLQQKMLDFSTGHGGHLIEDDFNGYEVRCRKPLEIAFSSSRVITNPPPSTGGILIAFALELLNVAKQSQDMTYLADVMAATNAARIESGLNNLESEGFGTLLNERLLTRYKDRILERPRSFRGTTHISVIDKAGNAAAVTLSNGEGCGRMVPGCGFMLNNMLGEEDINPKGFHNWPTDTRMSSMMAPTVICHADNAITALGSGGSNRIRTAVLQVIRNLVLSGEALPEAVEKARIHCEHGLLSVEGTMDPCILQDLSEAYSDITVWPERNMFFGGVHAVHRDAAGILSAHGDPRRGGSAQIPG